LNADYVMAAIRAHYDGATWLGAGTKGDLRRSVGAWQSGKGYGQRQDGQPGENPYIQKVWDYMSEKPWKSPGRAPRYF
jgi:hypothetical protein